MNMDELDRMSMRPDKDEFLTEEELVDLINKIENEQEGDEMMNQDEIDAILEYVDENAPETKIRKIGGEIVEMLIKKNHDYGDDNLVKRGLLGIIIRMEDKLARLDNLYIIPKKPHVEESLEDTLKDIAGYAINAIRLLREGKI